MNGRRTAIVTTPRFPWPLDDGGRIGLWQTVRSVATEWRVVLLSMVAPAEIDLPIPDPVAALDLEVIRVPHRVPPKAVAALTSAFGPMPVTLARYRSAPFAAALREQVGRVQPEFVLLNHLHLGTYAGEVRGVPTVLREHNVEFRWLERLARTSGNPLVSAYARGQARKMRGYERRCCERVDLVLGVQPQESALLREVAPAATVETVPIGVDFDRFEPRTAGTAPVVLLLASFGWGPNVEGARRFLEGAWPGVRHAVPDARLRLVGKDLPDDLRARHGRDGIEAVGYVERSEAELARASVLVVPLWIGAGARVKIVEALAARTPVVSTRLGAEGLDIADGTHYLEADGVEGLAEGIIALLRDPARAARLASEGYAIASRTFSLDAVGARMNQLIREAIRRHASGRPKVDHP